MKPSDIWSKVKKRRNGCWEWVGAVSSSGYGNCNVGGRTVVAHRVAYREAVGGIPLHTGCREPGTAAAYKKFVLHRCDNRLCCNPAHLFLGSARDNQLDAYAKGRKEQPKSRHTNAKLSCEDVRCVRSMYATGMVTQMVLADMFNISQRAVSLVVRDETYTDVL